MIEIRDLKFTFPESDFELRVDNLEIKEKESLAIIGQSGTGKTTLLNLLAGIVRPNQGKISIDGTLLSDLSQSELLNWRARSVGFIFQDFRLFEYLSLKENILVPLKVTNSTLDKEFFSSITSELGLDSLLEKKPGKVSQGEKQRAALARALITRPKLILADEPTGSLDPLLKQKALELLLSWKNKLGSTFLMVTHDHELLNQFDSVCNMADFLKA